MKTLVALGATESTHCITVRIDGTDNRCTHFDRVNMCNAQRRGGRRHRVEALNSKVHAGSGTLPSKDNSITLHFTAALGYTNIAISNCINSCSTTAIAISNAACPVDNINALITQRDIVAHTGLSPRRTVIYNNTIIASIPTGGVCDRTSSGRSVACATIIAGIPCGLCNRSVYTHSCMQCAAPRNRTIVCDSIVIHGICSI